MISANLLITATKLRVLVIAFQYVANYLIEDHVAEVFVYPRPTTTTMTTTNTTDATNTPRTTIYDSVIYNVFHGLTRWDGQHFMHIALYGYTYENTLAFFPLLPYMIHFIAKSTQVSFLTFESQVLLTFVVINYMLLLLTAAILYELTESWFGKHRAHISTLLFYINPATIFFTACYTESLFAFLTFSLIYTTWRMDFNMFLVSAKWLFISCLLISLSTLTRSNGILNVGFLVFFFVRNLRNSLVSNNNHQLHLFIKLLKLFCNLVVLAMSLIICLTPFVVLQFLHHSRFCYNFDANLPQEVVSHARQNGYRLVGNFYNQSWCHFNYIPMPYIYVQEHYWNVGFLKYYEFKQLPNFLLAFPIIYITLSECIRFLNANRNYLIHLGIFKTLHRSFVLKKADRDNAINSCDFSKRGADDENDLLFVCVVHAFFLCVFCIFMVHIQVTTRMIFSATPAIYWFCSNKNRTVMKLYCFSYFFIGIVLFSNFLPWT